MKSSCLICDKPMDGPSYHVPAYEGEINLESEYNQEVHQKCFLAVKGVMLRAQQAANAEARERRLVEEHEQRRELERARATAARLEAENRALRARLPANGAAVPLGETLARIEREKLK